MSYSTGEALLLTVVQGCTGFDSNNTSRANWLILNSGKADHYAILRPGPFDIEWISANTYQGNWITVVELWQRYKDDGSSQTNLYGHAANLTAGIIPKRTLGGTDSTIQDATVRQANEPQEMVRGTDTGPSWLKWELIVEWKDETQVTFS